jgi:radical SAM-linked protein
MQRLRIEFSRGEPVQYLSHLDLIRVFERAIRRAGIPIAYSEGFNPHPKLAFGPPLAVGFLSDREYVDITLTRTLTPEQLLRQFIPQCPEGIVPRRAAVVPDGAPALMAIMERAAYEVGVPMTTEVDGEWFRDRVRAFLDQKEVRVEREGKKGPEQREIRGGIYEFTGGVVPGGIRLKMEVRNDNEGSVRPDEVTGAFLAFAGLPGDRNDAVVRRTGFQARRKDKLVSPLEAF